MCREQTKRNVLPNKTLEFCSWNIHGYQSRQIGPKFRDAEFLHIVKNVDFLGLTETHIHNEILEELNIPGFTRISYKNREKKLKSGTSPGGIAVFAKAHIAKMFSVIKTDNQDSIWVKLKKELSGEEDDFFYRNILHKSLQG